MVQQIQIRGRKTKTICAQIKSNLSTKKRNKSEFKTISKTSTTPRKAEPRGITIHSDNIPKGSKKMSRLLNQVHGATAVCTRGNASASFSQSIDQGLRFSYMLDDSKDEPRITGGFDKHVPNTTKKSNISASEWRAIKNPKKNN